MGGWSRVRVAAVCSVVEIKPGGWIMSLASNLSTETVLSFQTLHVGAPQLEVLGAAAPPPALHSGPAAPPSVLVAVLRHSVADRVQLVTRPTSHIPWWLMSTIILLCFFRLMLSTFSSRDKNARGGTISVKGAKGRHGTKDKGGAQREVQPLTEGVGPISSDEDEAASLSRGSVVSTVLIPIDADDERTEVMSKISAFTQKVMAGRAWVSKKASRLLVSRFEGHGSTRVRFPASRTCETRDGLGNKSPGNRWGDDETLAFDPPLASSRRHARRKGEGLQMDAPDAVDAGSDISLSILPAQAHWLRLDLSMGLI